LKKTRMTNQRLKILEYLRSVKTHPTAETVYEAVKKTLPTITLATVYRNLNHLAETGEINRLLVRGVSHFDADTSCHQHAVCKECGRIIDLHKNTLIQESLKKIRIPGFKPRTVCIMIHGICDKCEINNKKRKEQRKKKKKTGKKKTKRLLRS